MDKKDKYIAVASSDGIVVNEHFGRASKFYIYQVSDEAIHLQEIREVVPVCNGGNHDEALLENNIKKLADCKYLLVSRIGNGAVAVAESYGVEAYEIPGIIEESIDQMIKYIKVKALFE